MIDLVLAGMQRFFVAQADWITFLKEIPDNSIDLCVVDVPYGLGPKEPTIDEICAYAKGDALPGGDFMGNDWSLPPVEVWRQARRVLKPGAFLMAYSHSRTFDLLSLGMRGAGLRGRSSLSWVFPTLMWLQAQGYAHSVNVGRAVDRTVCKLPGRHCLTNLPPPGSIMDGDHICPQSAEGDPMRHIGTALRSSWEPILIRQKPPEGTLVENVRKWGTGGLDIGGCKLPRGLQPTPVLFVHHPLCTKCDLAQGGWTCHPDCPCARLDDQAGERRSGVMAAGTVRAGFGYGGGNGSVVASDTYGDEGGASRFYPSFAFEAEPLIYVPKTSAIERELGCADLSAFDRASVTGRREGSAGQQHAGSSVRRKGVIHNPHPTPKPISLNRFLIRLGTPHRALLDQPPVVLDFAAGSGSIGCAAVLEGCSYLACDIEPLWVQIAQARIKFWLSHPDDISREQVLQTGLEIAGQTRIVGS